MLAISPVVLFPLILVCAFIYTYASIYIPIVGIVTAILLGGFAFLTGISCYGACHLFKVRNKAVALLFGLFVGAFTLHASWATFIFAYFQRYGGDQISVGFLDAYFNLPLMQEVIKYLYENGWFSIGRFGSGGDNVSGIFLGICWLVEAGVILAGPVIGSMVAAGEVFCERCSEWTEDDNGLFLFNLPMAMAAVPKIQERGFVAMEEIPPGSPDAGGGARLDACICRKCMSLFTLNLTKVEETVNDKGELENKEES
jgi:hypothetical protein